MTLAVWQATIVNGSGDIQPSVEVTVLDETTGLFPAGGIYADKAGSVPITEGNLFADTSGFVRFYVNPGEYRITVAAAAGQNTFRYQVITGSAAVADLTTSANSTSEGAVPIIRGNGGIFGLGGRTQDDTTNQPLSAWTKFFRGTSGTLPAGVSNMHTLHMDRGGTGQAAQFGIEDSPTDNPDSAIRVRGLDGIWKLWRKLWHEGNLIKTTTAVDNTEGSVPIIRGNGGIFGIGTNISPLVPDGILDSTSIRTGVYYADGSEPELPLATHTAVWVAFRQNLNNASQILINQIGDMYHRNKAAAVWGATRKVIDDSILNTDIWSGSINRILMKDGKGATTTTVVFSVDINATNLPLTLGRAGLFEVTQAGGASIKTAIPTADVTILPGTSSTRVLRVQVVNLTGIVMDSQTTYHLRSNSADASIQVYY